MSFTSPGSLISAGAASNLVADGAYIVPVSLPAALPTGNNSSVMAVVGAFSDGKPDVPAFISTAGGTGQLTAAFGSNTTMANSGVRSILSASAAGCSQFLVVRRMTGTETNAVLNVTDGSAGIVEVLTAINAGSNANGMTARLDLVSGTLAAAPVFRFTLGYPGNGQQVWNNIAGSVGGGAYAKATFDANFRGAVNGTIPGYVASPFVVATAGVSTVAPQVATTFTASAGTDSTFTTAQLIGVDGTSNRTGIYALKGYGFGGLLVAGVTDPTLAATLAAFLATTGGMGVDVAPSATSTDVATTRKAGSNILYPRIMSVMDWDYFPDPLSGQTSLLCEPGAVALGILMSISPWEDPSNKPENRSVPVLGTERTIGGQPLDPQGEGAKRKLNGIQYLTNGQPRTGNQFGLAHGKASDGSNIADTRMFDYVGARVLGILQRQVGKRQLPPPGANAIDIDPVRKRIREDFAALKVEMTRPGNQQLVNLSYSFTGTPAQVLAGYCPWNIAGQTLAGIEFAIAYVAVGTTVQAA